MTLPIADTTTDRTEGEFGDVDVSVATLETKRRPRLAKVAGVLILLGAGGYALHQSHFVTSLMGNPPATPAALGAAPMPALTTSVAVTVQSAPPTVSASAAAPPAPGPSVSPPRKHRTKAHPSTSSEEIDVGF
jgi:hypothetical protein